ncbi:cytochrome P450 4C1-like [Ctenocephalides felis]|uniref:cytochrome P450 4C1-like n=1 Tax=Ctenocephalides felis TaxID=7515 RepID=UPI000E6E1356|nr:cytochrome P450 4C1-like [Ctenocephalides felis]
METYGREGPFRIWFGHQLYVIVCKPKDIQIVLNKALQKGDVYRFSEPWTGHGLFTAPVSKWRSSRKLLSPAFNMKVLEGFVPVFQQQNRILVEKLRDVADKELAVDMFGYVSAATLDVICETAMGTRLHAQNDDTYTKLAQRTLKIESERMYNIFYYPDFIFYKSLAGKEFMKGIRYFRDLTDKVIKRKRLELNEKEKSTSFAAGTESEKVLYNNAKNLERERAERDDDDIPLFTRKRKAFLDLLFEYTKQEGQTWTDQQLNDEVSTMMIAGNDTTATVACFTMMMLGIHKSYQDLVVNELKEIFSGPDRNRDPEISDLQNMIYLDLAIKETMRLFPVGPFIVRKCMEDIKLESCTIPKGASIGIGIFGLHRDPELWPEPEQFRPERFANGASSYETVGIVQNGYATTNGKIIQNGDVKSIAINGDVKENEFSNEIKTTNVPNGSDGYSMNNDNSEKSIFNKPRHPYAYIPFSAGPRNCIGIKYAKISLMMMLSSILRNYEISCDYKIKDIKLQNDIILKPSEGYIVKLKHRKL